MDHEYYLSLDIGGSAVKYSVMNGEGHFFHKGSFPTPKDTLENFLLQLDKVLVEVEKQKVILKGIAISSCGAVNVETSVIHGSSAIDYIHGPNWRELIQQRYNLPCEIENDAHCAALAEAWKGVAQHCSQFCMVVIGSGIGGANVYQKKIIHGQNLHGGEFGYMIACYQDESPVTFSDVASTRGLIASVCRKKHLSEGSLTGIDIFTLAEEGDVDCQSAIDHWYQNLATGLFNLQYAFDPEIILIGGAVSVRSELISRIEDKIANILQKLPHSKVVPQIQACKLGNDANLTGALWHFLSRQKC
ncbi:ROK family protein [Vibrio gangliei]|uniref:ROK family protein n=1 Tax=Vibrio gangliei TaxID=2077090 RepID=UPI000D01AC85|nr:ROK family protein [Vibrio gangliei]